MSDDEYTNIISADYMYLIILGEDEIINKIVNRMNKNAKKKGNNKYFTSNRIDKPCAEMLDDETIQEKLINDAKNSIIEENNNDSDEDTDFDLMKNN